MAVPFYVPVPVYGGGPISAYPPQDLLLSVDSCITLQVCNGELGCRSVVLKLGGQTKNCCSFQTVVDSGGLLCELLSFYAIIFSLLSIMQI